MSQQNLSPSKSIISFEVRISSLFVSEKLLPSKLTYLPSKKKDG